MLNPESIDLDINTVLEHFATHGYARIGVVLSAAGAARLRERADEMMLGTVSYPGLYFQHDPPSGRYADLRYDQGWVGPSLAYRKLEHLELDAMFRSWIENPLFQRIARATLGSNVALYRAVLWNKARGAGTELPWHQDDGKFWGIDRAPSLQIWTALDDAPAESGALEVVPGSHLQGLASPEGGTVQPGRVKTERAEERATKLAARAGEAILIHNHLWHRSDRNRTTQPRRAFSVSYLDGATRCLRRRRNPRRFTRVFEGGEPVAPEGAG